jgi:hypothetical protein
MNKIAKVFWLTRLSEILNGAVPNIPGGKDYLLKHTGNVFVNGEMYTLIICNIELKLNETQMRLMS